MYLKHQEKKPTHVAWMGLKLPWPRQLAALRACLPLSLGDCCGSSRKPERQISSGSRRRGSSVTSRPQNTFEFSVLWSSGTQSLVYRFSLPLYQCYCWPGTKQGMVHKVSACPVCRPGCSASFLWPGSSLLLGQFY